MEVIILDGETSFASSFWPERVSVSVLNVLRNFGAHRCALFRRDAKKKKDAALPTGSCVENRGYGCLIHVISLHFYHYITHSFLDSMIYKGKLIINCSVNCQRSWAISYEVVSISAYLSPSGLTPGSFCSTKTWSRDGC